MMASTDLFQEFPAFFIQLIVHFTNLLLYSMVIILYASNTLFKYSIY